MSNIKPIKPSHTFGYWRPWKEDSNFIDSYLDYVRDTSLVKYGADTVGSYINQASKEQVQAISELGQAIGRGMNVLSNQMSDINDSLIFLNRNIDIQIEQQKLSNLLLQNIAELLRVPNSEKERQHSIELGIKFFVNAKKNKALYEDALEELLKAESLMKQDYFVLHRIGCIFLYVEKFINPEKALDYFLRAAKYASVESDSQAVRLLNAMNNTVNSKDKNPIKQIKLLASDSYEKAAFAAYILGQFSDAAKYQAEALSFNNNPQNRFLLSKYQIRNKNIDKGIKNLSKCIDDDPLLALASFKEIDLMNEAEVINLIATKNKVIDNEINKLLNKWKSVESINASKVVKELTDLLEKSYEFKVLQFKSFEKKADDVNKDIGITESKIDALITQIKKTTFCSIDSNAIIKELMNAKDMPLENMINVFNKIKNEVDADKLQIGAIFEGGTVFYIDKTGKNGLICANKDFGSAIWGREKLIGAFGDGIADGSGIENTKKIVEQASWETVWFTKKPIQTAARLCFESNYNGYNDWYLPTAKELELLWSRKKYVNGLKNDSYWSSTEDGEKLAYAYYWDYEFKDHYLRDFSRKEKETRSGRSWLNKYRVRAIRAFNIN